MIHETKNGFFINNEILSWDQYFLTLALVTSLRSKDPVCKVGACIVNPDNNHVLSLGYNGFPNKCPDDIFPWTKTEKDIDKNKFGYVVHAELNAILNAEASVKGAWIYVTHFPCNECCKAIIQSGITKIIYIHDDNPGSPKHRASDNMIKYANIEIKHIELLHYE